MNKYEDEAVKIRMIAGMIAIPWLMVACGGTPNRADQQSAVAITQEQNAIDAKVEYQGKPRYLKVSKVMEKRSDPLLSVFVEFTNTDNENRQGYYRITWLDENGIPTWEPEAWKTLLLHGNQKEMVSLVAPNSKKQDLKIQFNAVDNWRN